MFKKDLAQFLRHLIDVATEGFVDACDCCESGRCFRLFYIFRIGLRGVLRVIFAFAIGLNRDRVKSILRDLLRFIV